MAGHRDDGTFAEDKAHHPNRKVAKPTHEVWITDKDGYDWWGGEGSHKDMRNLVEGINPPSAPVWDETARIQEIGSSQYRYFNPTSPYYSGDPQYERATHPAFKKKG